MKSKKFCIVFAGVVGSSKTPIANYLSWNIDLPIYNNDTIRTEVTEDLLNFNQDEYIKRRDERGKQLVQSGKSFIYDASIDREWKRLHEWLTEHNYGWFIISLDLSKELLDRLYIAKGYTETNRLDLLIEQHKTFLKLHNKIVDLHITDKEFPRRLEASLTAVQNWLDGK